jgi:RNA polymerase sigma-70 factor (ECF subfamily)
MVADPAEEGDAGVAVTSDAIWRGFARQLLGYLRRRASDPSEAEDLLQEVFVKVHMRIGTLQDQSRVAPWLYQIARNTLIDHERRRRAPVALPEEIAAEQGEPENESERQIASGLRDMVDLLPDGYRQAVAMYEFDGLKQDEIGRRLGISLSGAKSRVQRGREMIRQSLLECCHFEFDRLGHIIDYQERQDCCARCVTCAGQGTATPVRG